MVIENFSSSNISDYEMISVPATREEITKEWLQQVLDDAEQDVRIDEMEVEEGSKTGDNYGALILRAKVKGSKADQPWSHSYILKIMPLADWAKKMIAEKQIFHKEVEAYKDIIPYMVGVQESDDQKLRPDVPRHYFAKTDDQNNGVIVLEDLKLSGYQLLDLKKGQDLNHCKLTMTNLARFHALGYKCRFASEEHLTKKYECLSKFLFKEAKKDWQGMAENALKFLDVILLDFPEKKEWKSRIENGLDNVIEKAATFDDPKTDLFYTICHGDTWSNNMLFKYGDDGLPVSLTLVDLQVMYYGCPARDLGYFFCLSTLGSLRKKHLKELLEIYRQELFGFLQTLGITQITEKELSFDKLWNMYYEKIHVGFYQAFVSLPILLMPPEMHLTPEEMKGMPLNEVAKAFQERARQNIVQDERSRERVFDLIAEMIENDIV